MGQEHVLVDAVEETCVLVGVVTSEISDSQAEEFIDELEFLALTAGAVTKHNSYKNFLCPIRRRMLVLGIRGN